MNERIRTMRIGEHGGLLLIYADGSRQELSIGKLSRDPGQAAVELLEWSESWCKEGCGSDSFKQT